MPAQANCRHLGRALDTARANGEAFFWDDALQRDSITWLVRLQPATLGEDGQVTVPPLRAGFPVFSVPMQLSLEDARFAPARIGPCLVNGLVLQAFTYRPAR